MGRLISIEKSFERGFEHTCIYLYLHTPYGAISAAVPLISTTVRIASPFCLFRFKYQRFFLRVLHEGSLACLHTRDCEETTHLHPPLPHPFPSSPSHPHPSPPSSCASGPPTTTPTASTPPSTCNPSAPSSPSPPPPPTPAPPSNSPRPTQSTTNAPTARRPIVPSRKDAGIHTAPRG